MKITHIASAYDVVTEQSGGRAKLIYLLAKQQQLDGHVVTVIAAPGSYVPGCSTRSFIKPVSLPKNKIFIWFIRRLIETYHHLRSVKWLGKSQDIIHNHILEEGLFFSSISKSPCVLTHHGGVPRNMVQYLAIKFFSIPSNTKLVAISRYTYFAHKKFFGNNLVDYVYNCIDTSQLPFFNKSNKLNDVNLIFVGRCVPEKGPHLAIKVADILFQLGYTVRLKLFISTYGGYTEYQNEILQMSNKRHYVDVAISRPTQEIILAMRDSDALLFPILWGEPFGYVMVEAMTYGVPVIAFNRGSVPEIISEGITGFVCDNVAEMVKSVENIHKIRRSECRKFVERTFSVNQTYQKYLKIYRQLLNSMN